MQRDSLFFGGTTKKSDPALLLMSPIINQQPESISYRFLRKATIIMLYRFLFEATGRSVMIFMTEIIKLKIIKGIIKLIL